MITANITDRALDKEKILNAFRSSGDSYEDNAIIQKQIASRLLQLLTETGVTRFDKGLEIGCCTGLLTENICREINLGSLYLNDIVPEFCTQTAARLGFQKVSKLTPLPGDIEHCPLPMDLDLVISSATFQWVEDLNSLFRRINRCLKRQGLLAFSIFSEGTMHEIRTLTGSGLQYQSAEDLQGRVAEQFEILATEKLDEKLFFPTVRAVLRHIKSTGVGGVGNRSLSHNELRIFEKQYKNLFATTQGIPVSYSSTIIVARKREIGH